MFQDVGVRAIDIFFEHTSGAVKLVVKRDGKNLVSSVGILLVIFAKASTEEPKSLALKGIATYPFAGNKAVSFQVQVTKAIVWVVV